MLWPQIWFNMSAWLPTQPQKKVPSQNWQMMTEVPSISYNMTPMSQSDMRMASINDRMMTSMPLNMPWPTEDAFPIDKIISWFWPKTMWVPSQEEVVSGLQWWFTAQEAPQKWLQAPTWDIKQVIWELWATILANPNANVEETKSKFPEFANVDTQVFWELWATIKANPNITIEEVMQKFPELSGVSPTQEWATPSKWSSSFQEFITPIASFSQWVSDIWQGLIGKPIERAAKNTLKLFWFNDDELEWLTTTWDITQALWEAGKTMVGKWSMELGRIAGSAALTAWMPFAWWVKLWGKWWAELIKSVAKRTLIGWLEGAWWAAAYNLWATDKLWEPIDLTTAAGIWAALWWPLSLIWSRVVVPWINALANKLQLSWLLNRSRLDRLSTILKQWGADELAAGTPEDVSNWMFQRNIKGSKEQIIKQLDSIADGSIELLDDVLSSSTTKHAPEWLADMLNVLKQEYEWAISAEIKSKGKRIGELIQKLNNEWWLTLSEINEVKKAINKDLNVFTASWKVKISKDDIASANRQLKQYIEKTVEQEGLSDIPVKLLNNEYAMASSMKKAIEEKLNTDMIWEIISFVNNRWWSSIGWALLWSQTWPFDSNTVEGKLWNIITGFLVGRFIGSTKAKTMAASILKKINPQQKAQMLNYIESRWEWKLSEQAKKVLQNNIKVDDISIPSNVYDDVSSSNVWWVEPLPSPTSTPVDDLPKASNLDIPQPSAMVKVPDDLQKFMKDNNPVWDIYDATWRAPDKSKFIKMTDTELQRIQDYIVSIAKEPDEVIDTLSTTWPLREDVRLMVIDKISESWKWWRHSTAREIREEANK